MEKENLIGSAILGFVFAFILAIAFSFSLSKGGFDDLNVFQQFVFYSGSVAIVGFGILCLIFINLLITKWDENYGDGIGFFDLGELPHIDIFKNYSGIQLTWLSTIIFFGLGILNFALRPILPFLQESYSGVLILQQFTQFENNIFSLLLVPIVESLWAVLFIGGIITSLRFIFAKFDGGENNFVLTSIIGVTLIMFFVGIIWHNQIYPESDVIRTIGGGFWAFGSLITILTGTIIPFWILHLFNNFFIIFAKDLASDVFLIGVVVSWIVLTVVYIVFYKGKSLSGVNE